jgi:3-deoxy-manno-octulosonate cytidylyltransferase (CMP-KDO synthetase)
MNTERVLAIIPARYASTRFPGKPLALIAGVPMIERVYRQTAGASGIDRVVVATDDQRIMDAVGTFGQAVMTRVDHPSGTDRVAEAAAGDPADIIINVQGDEPIIPQEVISALADRMRQDPSLDMATVGVPMATNDPDLDNPNVVKIVQSQRGRALYFSRAALPFNRDGDGSAMPLRHWGIYAYRRRLLDEFVTWPQSPLEQTEKLEQLRVLENGGSIGLVISDAYSIGVDSPEDVARVEAWLNQQG